MSVPGIAGQIQFQALFGSHSQGILGARLCGALGSLFGYYATASVWDTGVIASCSRWHQAGKTKFPGKVGETGLRIWVGQRGESGRVAGKGEGERVGGDIWPEEGGTE